MAMGELLVSIRSSSQLQKRCLPQAMMELCLQLPQR